jgi:cytochrome c biogenesis protein CcdA
MMTTTRVSPVHENELASRSTTQLISDLSDQLTRLIRAEMRLAQQEVSQKAKQAGMGVAMFGIAAVAGLFGLGTLIATAVIALDLVLPAWLSALIVAVLLLAVAGAAALLGRSRMQRSSPLIPQQTVGAAREDWSDIREAIRR